MSRNRERGNIRAYSVNDAKRHHPNSVIRRGLLHKDRVHLKKRVHFGFRICQLNVGTMTGRGREVADWMREKKIDVMCVQETRWKGNKAKEMGDGYKLWHNEANKQGSNGVFIVLSGELKNAVVEVHRTNNRIIILKICCGGEILNIISAYAPQVGCTEDEKEISGETWMGADLNGHIGSGNEVIGRGHGGYGIGREAQKERV
ncbi:uncharacterized protein [Palaemon carinicauda]|uniref:uncharacterized protein n=1 Tax=Palaemon carinicauda TaxID=392227 RepID=UPI0035B63FCB